MTSRSKVLLVWLAVGLLALVITVPLARPMRIGWQCYRLHANGVREQAEVLHKLENATFVLLVSEGPHAGEACTADTSQAIFDATEVGEVLEVVRLDAKPGECELTSTVEASAALLWTITGGYGAVLLGIVALASFLTRSFTRPVHPTRRLEVDPCCPVCGKTMDEGYLPVLAGIHWRKLGEPVGLPHALGGMPGTVGWRERPRLHAFRCVPCEVVTFRYGQQHGRAPGR